MRAMVLVVLGGTVLYLVWSGFGGVRASSAKESSSLPTHEPTKATGRLLSVAEMQAALESESAAEEGEDGGVDSGGGSLDVRNEPDDAPASESPAEETVQAPEAPLLLEWNLGDPVVEGSLLLHKVELLPDYLKGPGRQLSEGRKNLLFGLGLLIRGLGEHAAGYREAICSAPDVTEAERDLFLSVLEGESSRPLSASSTRSNPLLLGVQMALLDLDARGQLKEQRFRDAAEIYSALLLAEIDAPWQADRDILSRWSADLASAQARHRWNRNGEWPSIEVEARPGDNLIEIRKRVVSGRPKLIVSTGLISRANQLGKYLQPGPLRIPTDPPSMVVDLGACWSLYLHGAEVVCAWEVAIGREGKTTSGTYVVGEKLEDPPWFQTGKGPVPFGDPENPLGTRWIAWEGSDGLGFHGTWEPETIGTAASEGCVRMRNQDVEELFEILPRGAVVDVRP